MEGVMEGGLDGDVMGADSDWEDEDEKPKDGSSAKRDTKGEAESLYNSWKKLIPNLVEPLLKYVNQSTGQPTKTQFDATPCQQCDPSTQTNTRMIFLFWDRT